MLRREKGVALQSASGSGTFPIPTMVAVRSQIAQESPACSELPEAHLGAHMHTLAHTLALEGARLHFHSSWSYCFLPVKPNQPKI